MAITITNAARTAACDAIVDLVDVGASAPSIMIVITEDDYSGSSLLATIDLDGTAAFGAASNGVATLDTTPVLEDTNAALTGTAGFFQMVDGNGLQVMKGTVGTSGADINLDSLSIVAGGTVQITSGSVTMPAS